MRHPRRPAAAALPTAGPTSAAPGTPRQRTARALAAPAIAAAAIGLAACGSSGAGAPTTTAMPTTTTPETAAQASTAALAAYRGMWGDLVSAARTSDYRSPTLGDHTTGQALTLFVQGLARDQLHGIVTDGHVTLDPVVGSTAPSADPTRVTVTDCVDDSHWVEYTTSGGRAANPAGGRRRTTAVVARRPGAWKVTQLTVGAVGSC
jgi:hypothetical protein